MLSLALICVPGTLDDVRSCLKLARPLCDGRPFASPLFRRLANKAPFFREESMAMVDALLAKDTFDDGFEVIVTERPEEQ